MGFTLVNRVYSTLASGATSAATSLTVATGDGALFASASASNPIRCVIVDTSTSPETFKEYVDVTARSTDTLTVTRGTEGSSGVALTTGWYIAAVYTKGVLDGSYPNVSTWTTKGDVLSASAASTVARLAVGADGTQLVADSSQTTGLKWNPRSRATSRTATDTSAVNTTTETVVASQAIPTTVAAGDVVRLVAVGDLLNNTGGTVTYLPKAIIGATTVIASAAAGLSTSATRRQWVIQFEIVVNATNDERCRVESLVTGAGVSGWNISAGPVTTIGCAYGTAAEDLTAGKNAQISVTMGAASASADFVCHASWLEVIKA